jgi:hypothetical protein
VELLDPEKGNLRNFDLALDFAAKRLGPILEHFKTWVPQEFDPRPRRLILWRRYITQSQILGREPREVLAVLFGATLL